MRLCRLALPSVPMLALLLAGCRATPELVHFENPGPSEPVPLLVMESSCQTPPMAAEVASVAIRPAAAPMSISMQRHEVPVGEELSVEVTVDRDGFLSLLVTDDDGRSALLLPNARAASLPVRRGQKLRLPGDLGFKLRVAPPVGTTQITAVVTDRPIALPAEVERDPNAACVALQDLLYDARSGPHHGEGWISAEVEFTVLARDGARSDPRPDAWRPILHPPQRLSGTDGAWSRTPAALTTTGSKPRAARPVVSLQDG